MSHVFFTAAGVLATLWLAIHVFLGGREIAHPLLKATALPATVRHTQYLCWHFTTVAIAGMAGLYLAAAFTSVTAFATSATLLAAGFFVVGVGLVIALGERHTRLPQGWLFLPVAALGVAGHLA